MMKWSAIFKRCACACFVAGILPGITANARALTPSEREIVAGMRDAITVLRGKLAEAETANRNSLAGMRRAKDQVRALQADAARAAMEAAALAAERDALGAELAAQTVKYEKLNHRYQTAELIIAMAVGMLGLVLGLQLGAGLPMHYRMAVGAGAALLAAGAVYVFL